MRSNSKKAVKDNPHNDSAIKTESFRQDASGMDYGGGRPYNPKDEWLLKYEVNDKGVGRLLLPPSLSILLQSDRVSIRPSAGGLFIRSV
ncbi:MAG: hypothetical protein ACE14P_13225 [Methanotrichaceae archaeon]